ncbi:MAG TPA: hypothetical protein VFI73_01170 [Candidatus Nitrosopolaris sp.]|nr:hypothetical protein [Candidatus Nitrosopolaris sp.]
MLGLDKNKKKLKWKVDYENSLYKVYDWDKKLAGYFFPIYESIGSGEKGEINDNDIGQDEHTEALNKSRAKVSGGNLLVPMLKLNLLDVQEGIDLDYTIESLETNLERTKLWKRWITENHRELNIVGSGIYTAREDRNMLSILLSIASDFTLGEVEVATKLAPLLDNLHESRLL